MKVSIFVISLPSVLGFSASSVDPKPIPGMPCFTNVMPGTPAKKQTWVVGYHGAGAVAPEMVVGMSCSVKNGCVELQPGMVADTEGTLVIQAAPGAIFPDKAIGLIGCDMPYKSKCAAVEPGDYGFDYMDGGGALIMMVLEEDVVAPGNGMWHGWNEGDEPMEMKKGDMSPSTGLAVAFLEAKSVEWTVVPDGVVAMYCPVDLASMK